MPELVKNWSIESMIQYAWGVEAGLLANPVTAALATDWTKHIVILKQGRDARDEARQKTARAEARVRFFDADFDGQTVKISGVAYLEAGKKADAEPYHSMFGTVDAHRAVKLGAGKASVFGNDLVITAKKLGNAAVCALLDAYAAIVANLAKAGEERRAAARDEKLHDIDRENLLEDTEKLAARTEVELLKIYLGNPAAKDLVRAVLAVPKKESKEEEETAPAAAPA